MGARLLPSVLGITLLTGCAVQDVQTELPSDHPANPAAAVASVPARSTTLRAEPVNAEVASAPHTGHDHAAKEQDAGSSAHDHDHQAGAGETAGDAATAEADAGGEYPAHGAEVDGAGKLPALSDGPAAAMYVCPMHKEITSDEPGKCPKCKMKLKATKSVGGGAAALYVCPMHKEVTSATPARCPKCKMKLKARKPGGVGAASDRPSAGDTAATVEPASAGSGDAAASESAEGDGAHDAHEGHGTQEPPREGGGENADEPQDAHEGHDTDGGDK